MQIPPGRQLCGGNAIAAAQIGQPAVAIERNVGLILVGRVSHNTGLLPVRTARVIPRNRAVRREFEGRMAAR